MVDFWIFENTLIVSRFLDERARVRTMASVAKLASEPHDDYTSNNFEREGANHSRSAACGTSAIYLNMCAIQANVITITGQTNDRSPYFLGLYLIWLCLN